MKLPWIAFVVVAGALPVLAVTAPAKPVWQWRVDERLAARFDEAARTQRVDDYLAQRALRNPQSAARSAPMMPRPVDVVHGTKHPELLLPHEIFTTFTRAAFEPDGCGAARRAAQVARRLPCVVADPRGPLHRAAAGGASAPAHAVLRHIAE